MGPQPIDDVLQLIAIHSGKHSLYEVNARVVDLDEFDKVKHEAISYRQEGEFVRVIGNLVAGTVSQLPHPIALGSADSRRFNIFFMARNGSFSQLLRCQRVAGTWLFATRVLRSSKFFLKCAK